MNNASRRMWEAARASADAEADMSRQLWNESEEYAKRAQDAALAKRLAEARRTHYKVTQQARQAAREVGCGEYRPSLAHCISELRTFVERAEDLNRGVN